MAAWLNESTGVQMDQVNKDVVGFISNASPSLSDLEYPLFVHQIILPFKFMEHVYVIGI